MNAPGERRSPTILDVLRSRVRAASDGQLVLVASLGVIGLCTMGYLRRWPWAGVASCGVLLGAGIWGILDRGRGAATLNASTDPLSPLGATRTVAGAVALVSLLALLLGAFGLCLGPWIS